VSITTTAGETFTAAESRELARLILKRWGGDPAAAACAWRRLMQNNCTDEAFADLASIDCSVCGGQGWGDGSAALRRDGRGSTECLGCNGTGRVLP
jgi:hypothetical protein